MWSFVVGPEYTILHIAYILQREMRFYIDLQFPINLIMYIHAYTYTITLYTRCRIKKIIKLKK